MILKYFRCFGDLSDKPVYVLHKLYRSDTQWWKGVMYNPQTIQLRTHSFLLNPYKPAITSLRVTVKLQSAQMRYLEYLTFARTCLSYSLFETPTGGQMRRSSVSPDSPPLHWPALTFYPESSYRPPLSRVVWFVGDRGCGGAAAGTLTVLALIEALGGGFDNDFAENSCLQWWGGEREEVGAALNEFVNDGSKIKKVTV